MSNLKHYAILIAWLLPTSIFAQNDSIPKAKKGLAWGFIPALSYDTDLGLKYGAVINMFDYGNGKHYPHYQQFLQIKLTNTTKKSMQLHALFESETLIKEAITIVDIGFWRDIKLDFFGFNGTNTIFNPHFTNPKSQAYINRLFYSHQRRYFRFRFDVQKNIVSKTTRLLTGVSYNFYKISPQNKLNYKPPADRNLYDYYNQWGIIPQKETNGGHSAKLKLGFIFDTRNEKCFCTNGNWIETVLIYSQGLAGASSYLKSSLTVRYYKDLISNEKLSFATRLSFQNKLWGSIPFYELPVYYDTRLNQDGIGGAYTLRGVMRNRIAADGFALANNELKLKLFNFSLLRLDFMVAISAFADVAYVLQEYQFSYSGVPVTLVNQFFSTKKQGLNLSYGPGIYIIFNKNNVISVNYGFAGNKQLGESGLYVGSSLLF